MMPSSTQHAIGALKLVALHLDHPTVVSPALLRAAAKEAIERLQNHIPHADDLSRLYAALFAVTPRGHLPHVTLTTDATVPYGAVITDAKGNIVTRQVAKSIDGLVQIIATRFGPTAEERRA